jgi:hypothetical protein
MNQMDIERLYQAINGLRIEMLARFDKTDSSIKELREYTDLIFSEERKHTDRIFSEAQKHTDQRFNELQHQLIAFRNEVSTNMRWMMGVWLSTMGMIAGRVFGFY